MSSTTSLCTSSSIQRMSASAAAAVVPQIAGSKGAKCKYGFGSKTDPVVAVHERRTSRCEEDEDADRQLKTLDADSYWREDLEKLLHSLMTSVLIMLLVLVDVGNVLVTLLGTGEDTLIQTSITFVVLGLFLTELSLRMLAIGARFFKSYWNWFDTFVIYASIGFALANFFFTTSGDTLQTAKSSTAPLRIFSRVAMGLRVMRVLLHMRKVSRLQGTMATQLRTAVSQNKRRYTHHGFDLDLTYITDRIIAMSAPALGGHKTYRNDIHIVSRFLSRRHYGAFFCLQSV